MRTHLLINDLCSPIIVACFCTCQSLLRQAFSSLSQCGFGRGQPPQKPAAQPQKAPCNGLRVASLQGPATASCSHRLRITTSSQQQTISPVRHRHRSLTPVPASEPVNSTLHHGRASSETRHCRRRRLRQDMLADVRAQSWLSPPPLPPTSLPRT
jgi:hypothetical protein